MERKVMKNLLSRAHPLRRVNDNKTVIARLLQLREQLGAMGLASLGLLAAGALFTVFFLNPMQDRNRQLESSLARHASRAVQLLAASGKLESFYAYLGKSEAPTDWLAKLYGIGKGTGVELQSATYRTPSGEKGTARIERYEIVLPVSGTYPQVRDFLRRALAEIPVLSLDQLTLKRESRNEGDVQAELKMTLHLVKP
jgi:hypothetical protein